MTRKIRQTPIETPRKGFDISTRRMAESIEITLVDPVDPSRELDAHITLLSPRAKPVMDAVARPTVTFDKDGKPELNGSDFETSTHERIIAATIAWDLTDGGEPIPCTPEHVRRIYEDPATSWIEGQAQRHFFDTARFFPTAPSGS